MIKKISELTPDDKERFLEQTKQAMLKEYGTSWEVIEERMRVEIDNTFDDEKFAKMDPDSRIDAAYARKEFGNRKPDIVDYMLWSAKFVSHSEYIDI